MKKILLIIICLLSYNISQAQFIKNRSIDAQIGIGKNTPFYSSDTISGSGFILKVDYVLKVKSWFELRPYAGYITVDSKMKTVDRNPTSEFLKTNALFLGGKFRLRAPIPWFAPYIETGIGTSIGNFQTFTRYTDLKKTGIDYHIPLGLGLELGPKNNFDLGLSYFFQPNLEQFSGGVTIGFSIPLDH